MTEADFARWAAQWRTPPAAIVPVPALTVDGSGGTLRGARVLIGLPGHGWRGEMRADALVKQGARTFVPVLPEADWYRAERDRVEVVAALVPVERVWIETLSTADAANDLTPSPADAPQLVSLDSPPTRAALPLDGAAQVMGRRLVHTGREGETRALRAASEAHKGPDSLPQILVVTESDWYAWAATGKLPAARALPVAELWLE
ncbi:hypothetical protein Rhe02_64170 [Rhizocola hellebori]|uniref:MOSC domain-containing protein n=1 Tax=Rhizocola hellebori TaxID=1392758 RepID=A0A8J3VJ77_9ACTN|nr:hypothetical protein Rhe02_64170 [Rhizocola hellebori]